MLREFRRMQEALRDVNPEGAAFNRNDDYHEQEQVQVSALAVQEHLPMI